MRMPVYGARGTCFTEDTNGHWPPVELEMACEFSRTINQTRAANEGPVCILPICFSSARRFSTRLQPTILIGMMLGD